MLKWFKSLFDNYYHSDGHPEWFFPDGKNKYRCPKCKELMEKAQLYDTVVYEDRVELYHKGCYK